MPHSWLPLSCNTSDSCEVASTPKGHTLQTALFGTSLLGNSYLSQGHHFILFPSGNQILMNL